ncbi:MAG: GNAT family N-acetyltransferase [Acidobacteria bacterium]|nr:GNAT family N-acetyltransferase [Acidobacteriota bacterium]
MNNHTYDQISEIPGVEEYRQLRVDCGLSPKTVEAAAKGLPNSLFSTTIRDHGRLIGMGRVIGDDGCNFEVVDIAVHPDYQRQGLGGLIMAAITRYIEQAAPNSAYVSLIADHHSPALYAKYGFKPTAPVSIGIAYKVS